MGLVREQYETGGSSIAANGLEEFGRLEWGSAGIRVLGTVHEKQRRPNFVSDKEGRDFQVYVGGFPDGTAFVLEAERCERLVVGTAGGDSGTEQVGVRDQVHSHQSTVAVSGDTNTVWISDSEAHGFVDCGLSIGNELVEVGIVSFLWITDDGEGSAIDNRVTSEKQKPVLSQLRKGLLRSGHLTSGRGIGIVERISVKNCRHARAFLIAGRRVEREGEVKSVGALVLDETLLDGAYGRRGIGNVRDRRAGRGEHCFSVGWIDLVFEGALECVGWIGGRLMPRQKRLRIGSGKGEELFIARLLGPEKTFGLLAREIEAIEEGAVAVRGGALSAHIDRITFLADYPGTVRELAVHRRAGVFVQLVGGEIPKEAWSLLRIVDIDSEGFPPVAVLVVLGEQSELGLLTPVVSGEALLGTADFDWRRIEGRPGNHDFVAIGNIDVPVAAVEGFGPNEGGGIGGAPIKITWT